MRGPVGGRSIQQMQPAFGQKFDVVALQIGADGIDLHFIIEIAGSKRYQRLIGTNCLGRQVDIALDSERGQSFCAIRVEHVRAVPL